MLNKGRIIFVIALAFLCECKNSTGPSYSNVMVPLTNGNSWTFEDTSYAGPDYIQYTGTITVTVTGSGVINGKTYALFDDILTGPTRNDAQGTWRISLDSTYKEYLLYKYPGS